MTKFAADICVGSKKNVRKKNEMINFEGGKR